MSTEKELNIKTYDILRDEQQDKEVAIILDNPEQWDTHQVYSNKNDKYLTRSLQRIKCGSLNFEVGKGDYLTVIRCCYCKEEIVIHEG